MNTGIQKNEHITYKYTFMKTLTCTHPFVSEFLERECVHLCKTETERQKENETGRERKTETLEARRTS